MTLSVNTNVAAMVALQNLNGSTRELEVTQNRVSTGLKTSSSSCSLVSRRRLHT